MRVGDKIYCIKSYTADVIYKQIGLYSYNSYSNIVYTTIDKLYEIIEINELNLYILGDDNSRYHFSISDCYYDCYKNFFITTKQLRKIKLDILRSENFKIK